MAALTFRTRSLAAAKAVLKTGNIPVRHSEDRLVVPATAAFGVTLEFRA